MVKDKPGQLPGRSSLELDRESATQRFLSYLQLTFKLTWKVAM
jgi:hypothetical protein